MLRFEDRWRSTAQAGAYLICQLPRVRYIGLLKVFVTGYRSRRKHLVSIENSTPERDGRLIYR